MALTHRTLMHTTQHRCKCHNVGSVVHHECSLCQTFYPIRQNIPSVCLESGTENCVTETVKVPQKTRITRETVRTVYDFMATIALVDSKAKRVLFSFWMYDGDVLLTSHPTVVKINKGKWEF